MPSLPAGYYSSLAKWHAIFAYFQLDFCSTLRRPTGLSELSPFTREMIFNWYSKNGKHDYGRINLQRDKRLSPTSD